MLLNTSISRWRAAATHLLISSVIALLACLLIILVWYPSALFWAFGGAMLLALLVGVDVCLGPLMTLILFNPKKARKLIVLDLSIIALIQLGALVYGLHTAYVARPAFVVYDNQQFSVISANDIEPEWLAAAELPQYRQLPNNGPQWVAIRAAKDNKESSDQSFYRAVGKIAGAGLETQVKYYVPLAQEQKQLIQVLHPLDKWRSQNPDKAKRLDLLLKRHKIIRHIPAEQLGWLPVNTRRVNLIALINKNSGEVITLFNPEDDLN